jgi:hypothetical protein
VGISRHAVSRNEGRGVDLRLVHRMVSLSYMMYSYGDSMHASVIQTALGDEWWASRPSGDFNG